MESEDLQQCICTAHETIIPLSTLKGNVQRRACHLIIQAHALPALFSPIWYRGVHLHSMVRQPIPQHWTRKQNRHET